MGVFDQLFRKRSSGPADEVIRWLTNKSIDDRRFIGSILYGGPHSRDVQKWILSRGDCDVGTAALFLWEFGRPDLVLRETTTGFPLEKPLMRELIHFIVDRWPQDLFASAIFDFDNRENTKLYRRELKKKGLQGRDPFEIPEAAWQPVKGRKVAPSEAATPQLNPVLTDLLNKVRLADMAELHPAVWEPIRRRSLGLK